MRPQNFYLYCKNFHFFASKMQKNHEFQIPFLKDLLCLPMIRLSNIYGKASLHERDMNFIHLSLEMILALNFVEWTSRALEAEDQTLPRKLKTTS